MENNILHKIQSYFSGEANDEDKAWVESQFLEGEKNHKLRTLLEKDWNSILKDNSTEEKDLSRVLDRVHHLIIREDYQNKQRMFSRMARAYMKAAAVLLVPLFMTAVFLYFQSGLVWTEGGNKAKSTIYAPLGSRVAFNLPDGTTGMLNSGSELTYSTPFNKNRLVSLVGEAWFEVAEDQKHPFEVYAVNSAVRVLGTSFNLNAYPSENYVEVVLKEGEVEFTDNKNGRKVTLRPNERLVCKNGNFTRTEADPEKYLAWTQGRMVFNNDPMAEVARRIERWYSARVILADKELEEYSFRGTFEDDKLEEVMRLLALTSPIRYEIKPRKLLSDGSFEKETVIIYLKQTEVSTKK